MHITLETAGATTFGPWLEWLFDLSIRATVLLAVAWFICTLLRRGSARLRYLVWTTAVLGVLAQPLLQGVLPAQRWVSLPTLAVHGAAPASSADVGAAMSRLDRGDSAPLTAVAPTPRPAATPSVSVASIAVVAWLIGAGAMLAWLAIGLVRVRRFSRRAIPASGPAWSALLADLKIALDLSVPMDVRLSDDVPMPLTWGARRPVILLPRVAETWSDDRRRIVLLHELVHIDRRDWIVQMIAQVTAALHWFNPLMWLALRGLGVERERACDREVVARGTKPSLYASHLLEVARIMRHEAGAGVATLAMARFSQLEGRLIAILNRRGAEPGSRYAACAAVTVTVAIALALAAPHYSAAAGGGRWTDGEDLHHPALATIVARYQAVEKRLAPLEAEQFEIDEHKAPHYARRDAYASRLEVVTAERDAAGNGDPARLEALEREMTRLQREIDSVNDQLEPWIDKWLEIEERKQPIDDELFPIGDEMAAVIAEEVRRMIGDELHRLGGPTSRRGTPALDRVATDLADEVVESSELLIEEGRLWLVLSTSYTRRLLRDALLPGDGNDPIAPLAGASAASIDAAVDRLATGITTLRYAVGTMPGPVADPAP